MASQRLYRTNPYQKRNRTSITSVANKDGLACISCEASCFFPEGGGQPSDRGTIRLGDAVFKITAAYDDSLESDVWHLTDAPADRFAAGDEVELEIDWAWRFCNMQRHCGEHMLSGTLHSLFGGINRGFHMGEEYITIDIELGGRMLTEEELLLTEQTVNQAIWDDLPVSVRYFDTYQESLVMPVRKQVPHEGQVSVVSVGELPEPYDCIACCGTHPSSSGQVGLLAIYKLEANKGMNRIYFDCGIMAHKRLCADSKLLTEISNRYSCSTTSLLHRLELETEELSTLKGRLANMSAYIKEAEAGKLLAELADCDRFAYSLDLLSVDDLLKLGFSVIGATEGKLLVLMHPSSCTALLFSSGAEKCGTIIKQTAPDYNGRGGGRDDNARAVFNCEKDMKAFAAAICK